MGATESTPVEDPSSPPITPPSKPPQPQSSAASSAAASAPPNPLPPARPDRPALDAEQELDLTGAHPRLRTVTSPQAMPTGGINPLDYAPYVVSERLPPPNEIFYRTMSAHEMMAVFNPMSKRNGVVGATMPPPAQWRLSMWSMVRDLYIEQGLLSEFGFPIRSAIVSTTTRTGIIIDIYGVREVPPSVRPLLRLSGQVDENGVSYDHEPIPMLEIAYVHGIDFKGASEDRLNLVDSVRDDWGGFGRRGPVLAVASSEAEIEYGLQKLAEDTALLSPAYVDTVQTEKRRRAGFRPGIILPRMAEKKEAMFEKIKIFCSWSECTSGVTELKQLKVCANCRSAQYCGKKCQRAHWKRDHRKVCKPHAESDKVSRKVEVVGDRPSVCVPAAAKMKNFKKNDNVSSTISLLTGQTQRTPHTGKPTRNIHGDKEFMVKFQIPILIPGLPIASDKSGGLIDDVGLLYDKARSFQTQVDLKQGDLPALTQRIRDEGFMGVKAYLMAKREGPIIRLFTDRFYDIKDW